MEEVVLEDKTIKIEGENMFIMNLSDDEVDRIKSALDKIEEEQMIMKEGDIPVSNVFLVSVGEK